MGQARLSLPAMRSNLAPMPHYQPGLPRRALRSLAMTSVSVRRKARQFDRKLHQAGRDDGGERTEQMIPTVSSSSPLRKQGSRAVGRGGGRPLFEPGANSGCPLSRA